MTFLYRIAAGLALVAALGGLSVGLWQTSKALSATRVQVESLEGRALMTSIGLWLFLSSWRRLRKADVLTLLKSTKSTAWLLPSSVRPLSSSSCFCALVFM